MPIQQSALGEEALHRVRGVFRSFLFCALACIAIIIFAWIVIGKERDLRSVNLQVRTSRNIEVTAERVLGSLRDAETGQRGYLLTQNVVYLEPFDNSEHEVLRLAAQLESYTANVAEQLGRAQRLTSLVKLKLAELSETVDLTRAGNLAAALAIVNSNQGRDLMEEIRAIAAQIDEASGVAAQTFRDRADEATHNLVVSVIATSGASIGLLILLTYSLRRDGRRIRETSEQLEKNLADLRVSEEELRIADRHKDEFLATLAHELRNPVAPIRHAIKLLESGALSEQQQRWSRAVIARQTGHIARLLDDLLDSARITRGELVLRVAAVDLKEVITEALDVAGPIIERKGHILDVILPQRPLTLMVDGIRISQVLSNLLTNAAKYTDAGGRIALEAQVRADKFLMSVKDSGVGLSAEAIPRVFQMFNQIHSTLDRSEGGLGIGLSLAAELIRLHGGRIDVHSEGPGLGSEFVIALPASVVTDQGTPVTAAAHAITPAPAARLILVIDDNKDAAASLGMLLELSNNEVLTAHTGEEGLDMARQRQPAAIVIDIGLPGIDGYEVARTIRRESWGRAIFLIALTGWGQTSDKERAFAAGFDHHLTKPADPDALQQLIDNQARVAT